MALRRSAADRDPGVRLSELYREFAPAAYRFALHLSGRREDAEDIVQFAFLQAHRTIVAGGRLENPRAWLMTTVRRRWLTILRDRHDIPVEPAVLEPLAAGRDATYAGDGEELAAVRANLWALPEQQHQAFVLRHWSGLSHQEIAAVLETTPSAVESLLVRARVALVADRDLDPDCAEARRRLAGSETLSDRLSGHLRSCARCRTARSRLARAGGIAAALALAPRMHVADAIASTVPGFSAGAASAGLHSAGGAAGLAGGGTSAGGLGMTTAATAGKVALAAKALVVVGTAAAAVTVAQVAHVPSASSLLGLAHSAPAHAGSGASAHGRGAAASAAGRAQAAAHAQTPGGGPGRSTGHRATAKGRPAGAGHRPPASTPGRVAAGTHGNGGAANSGSAGPAGPANPGSSASHRPAKTTPATGSGNAGGAVTSSQATGSSGTAPGHGKGH